MGAEPCMVEITSPSIVSSSFRFLKELCPLTNSAAICCSATRLMAGQRQPDGRSLRTTMMAWLTCRDKQRCRRSPLCGEHLTVKKPVDLCITQARYTQLHRPINNSQDGHFIIL